MVLDLYRRAIITCRHFSLKSRELGFLSLTFGVLFLMPPTIASGAEIRSHDLTKGLVYQSGDYLALTSIGMINWWLLVASLFLIGGMITMSQRKKMIKRRLAVVEKDFVKQVVEVSRTETTGRISASLAHDLKQPIASILLNAQGAIRLMKRAEINEPDLEESLADIVSDVSRLDKIVVGLSGIVQPGKSQTESLDLNHEVRDVLDLLAGEILKNGVRLITQLTEDVQPIAWKRGELRHVIITLVLNALDKVSGCSKERRIINIKTEMSHGCMQLSVEDLGSATVIDVLPYLKSFTQEAHKPRTHDLDMGALSYCAHVVESHQGSIEALSPTGIGCLIRIHFPILAVTP